MTTSSPSSTPTIAGQIGSLRSGMRGRALLPMDSGFDEARTLWNAMIDRKPAVIAQCAGVADVVHALGFARALDLSVAVRAGGHNVAGTALCDDGLVIDLTHMNGVRIDAARRTARVEGGVTWGELDRETQQHGLATTGGVIPSTGVSGLTLGGGLGWLMRKHGLSCDNLLSAELVTADSDALTASDTQNQELFWGLRGGGGNFGVVTSMEFKLHPVGPELVAGPIFYPREAGRELFRFARDRMADQPDELLVHLGIATGQDGTQVSLMIPAYDGPVADGEAAVAPLKAYGAPLNDMVGAIPYLALQGMFNASYPAGRRNYWKSAFVDRLTDEIIDVLVDSYASTPSPYSTFLAEQMGGAIARVDSTETAFPHRSSTYNFAITSAWDDPAGDEANIRWVQECWAKLEPHLTSGVYVNYLSERALEGGDRVRAAYGPNYNRLAALKQHYDPQNRFRHNQNIVPAKP